MGQYSRRLLEHLAWQRRREQEWRLIRQIADAVKNPKHVELDPLLAIIPDPQQLEKTVRRIFPKAQTTWRKYHWWQEPDGALRKIDSAYIRTKLEEARAKYRAATITEALRILGASDSERSLYSIWTRSRGTVGAKTRTLKRFCDRLGIPYHELEILAVIKDRKFPIDLHAPPLVKLYTHMLNEGSIDYTPQRACARYVNKDPVLARHVADLVAKAGGRYTIPPPMKEAIELRTDPTTARALAAAGLKPGTKTITNPPLHPAILRDKQLAKYHIHMTIIEEGHTSLTINRHNKLELHIGLGRSIDITNKLPPQTLKQLQQHPGQSFQPKKVLTPDVYYGIVIHPEAPPIALRQEYDIVIKTLKQINSAIEIPPINCSYIHVSQEGRITAHYRFSIRGREAAQAFYQAFFADYNTGTWKEAKLHRQIELLNQYQDVKLTPAQQREVKREMNTWHRISEQWIIEKAKKLLPEAEWINKPNKIRKLQGKQ